MNREVHVRFCEGLEVEFPGPTRPALRTCALHNGVSYLRDCGRAGQVAPQPSLTPCRSANDLLMIHVMASQKSPK
jgi:hypothetical protein